MKPHICCYLPRHVDNVERAPSSSRIDLGYAELFIDVKPDPSHDFFVDPEPTADRGSHEFLAQSDEDAFAKHRDRAFGQHIAYAAEVFARQHRLFLFSISMSGSLARFIRWDRAGCIVSESFDIRAHPEILCEFLGRFAQTDDTGRGHDITVEPALPEEEQLFRDAIREHVRLQLACDGDALDKAVSEHYQPGHITAMYVMAHYHMASEESIGRFLVSRPVASSINLTGRGTRGWWGVDPSTRQVVFLKDTWRIGHYGYVTEGEALGRMGDAGVRNIPSLVWHGDVPSYIPRTLHEFTRERLFVGCRSSLANVHLGEDMQCSLNHKYSAAPWLCKVDGKRVSLTEHWHYRIVMGTVGYGLRHFTGTEELLHATYDVLQGRPLVANSASLDSYVPPSDEGRFHERHKPAQGHQYLKYHPASRARTNSKKGYPH